MPLLAPLVIAQISDCHLFANERRQLLGMPTIESFQAVLKQVGALQRKPDLLLLTGDLSQDGKPESYELLKELVTPLAIPTYWLPGNHDCVPVMEQVLQGGFMFLQKSFYAGAWNFLLLNSQVPGSVHGRLSSASLDWLEKQLQTIGNSPTVVAMHHPPFEVGSAWLDGSSLQNPNELFEVLDRHPQVKLVLFGHIHQEYSHWRNGVQYFGVPSTCIQFEPHSSDFSLDEIYPGFRLLYLYRDATWWTTVERAQYSHQPDMAATGY
jgi:Icc protein